jgi:hypothetical protein
MATPGHPELLLLENHVHIVALTPSLLILLTDFNASLLNEMVSTMHYSLPAISFFLAYAKSKISHKT